MPQGDKLVLVTGATGHQGGATANELLQAGWRVRAMTRRPDSERARNLARLGAEVVQGDLDDEASLRKALAGAWGALAVQNTWEAGVELEEIQGKRFAHVAKEVGVQHLVYQSVASADRDTGIPHFDNKYRIEQEIESLDFPSYVIVRPVFFMENLLGQGMKPQDGVLAIGMKPDTRLQMIAVEDIGKYAFAAFDRADQLNGRDFDIAGDELTGPEMAAVISEVSGRKVEFKQVPIEQIRAFSEDYAIMLEWFDEVGYDVDIEATSSEFGIRPTRFAEWARKQVW
jgi:uncharacterized protein YbjT (DUF2867 family)